MPFCWFCHALLICCGYSLEEPQQREIRKYHYFSGAMFSVEYLLQYPVILYLGKKRQGSDIFVQADLDIDCIVT